MFARIFPVLVLVGLLACSSQTTRARRNVSAQQLACAPADVDVSDQTDNTWTAECGNKRMKCVAHGNDNRCEPDPPPPAK
jgi:hypothetical protein